MCVCEQLCACVYCMKGWHTPTPAVAEVSGTPPPISGSQPGWEVASLETWLLASERTFWRPLSLACITKLKVLLPCEGSMWSRDTCVGSALCHRGPISTHAGTFSWPGCLHKPEAWADHPHLLPGPQAAGGRWVSRPACAG